MTRSCRIPFLVPVALFAIGVGSALPYSPTILAAQSSCPAEEEKSSIEQDDVVKLAHPSSATPTKTAAGPTLRPRTANSAPPRPRVDALNPASPLNNGLGTFYRC